MGLLITTSQANRHLRLDMDGENDSPPFASDERLQDLELKIEAAESIVLDYLKADRDVFEGSPPNYSASSPVLWVERDLKVIRSAVLLLLSALWDDAPDRTVADYMKRDGTIPLLLARLRDPALA